MPVAITPLGLARVRRTDSAPQITINGSGFSAANNSVFVGGSAAPPIVQGVNQITVNLPSPFSLDVFDLRSIHVPVVVINNDTGEQSDDAWVWIKGDLDEVADEEIDTALPGPFEQTGGDEAPRFFESRDMQRLAGLIESLLKLEPGNVLAWDGSQLTEPTPPKGSGQLLLVDAGEPTSLAWGFRADAFLKFGGAVSWLTGVRNAFACNGDTTALGAAGDENWALDDGVLDLITFRGRSSGGGTITRVRVLVDGLAAYDSGVIAVVGYNQAINVPVTRGQRIELEITPSLTVGHQVNYVGGIRLLLD